MLRLNLSCCRPAGEVLFLTSLYSVNCKTASHFGSILDPEQPNFSVLGYLASGIIFPNE
jgi:hypothetical protein